MEKERILKALKTIQEVCEEQETCSTCPLRDTDNGCMLDKQEITPCDWNINFDDRPWRALNN